MIRIITTRHTNSTTTQRQRKHAQATQIHADLRHNGTGRGFCGRIAARCARGGCIAVQTPKHGLRRPPLLAAQAHKHIRSTERGMKIDRTSARGRALAATRRILPRSLLLGQKEAAAAAGCPLPCPHLPWVHVRLVSERRVPQGDGRWAKGRSKRWHGAGGVQEQAEP